MNNNDMEQRLRSAVHHATPDVLEDILARCDKGEEKIVGIESRRAPAKAGRRLRPMIAAAAALALTLGILGFGHGNKAYAADYRVSMDADGRATLEISENGDVLSAAVWDENGGSLIDGGALEGMDLQAAAGEIAKALVDAGVISEEDNSMIIAVSGEDAEKARELQDKLMEALKTAFEEEDVSAALIGLSQGVDSDPDAKAALIDRALEALEGYGANELDGLSVNELNLLIENKSVKMDGVVTIGSASDSAVVGKEAAQMTAAAHAGVTETDGYEAGVELDCKYGKLVYGVGFEDGRLKFTYNIDAADGSILSWAAKAIDGAEAGSENSAIGLDRAREIALEHAGISGDAVRNVSIDLNENGGSLSYDLQFSADGVEYEYDVDAATGLITKYAAALVEGVLDSALSGSRTPGIKNPPEAIPTELEPGEIRELIGSIFDFIAKVG